MPKVEELLTSGPPADEAPVLRARLEESARPWTAPDGHLRFPLEAFAVVA